VLFGSSRALFETTVDWDLCDKAQLEAVRQDCGQAASAPFSLRPIRREYATTSAATTAASLRCSRAMAVPSDCQFRAILLARRLCHWNKSKQPLCQACRKSRRCPEPGTCRYISWLLLLALQPAAVRRHRDIVPAGCERHLRAIGGAHPAHDLAHMDLDGAFVDVEPPRDVLV
jgi:hypothetical protein